MTADDELIARALDGELSPEESAALDERIKRDPAVARSLMELARTEALLQDAAAAAPAPELQRGVNKGGIVTMAAILLVSATAFWVSFGGLLQDRPKAEPAKDGDRLRAAWPKLVDAWHALQTCKGDTASDEYLKAMSRVHGAFEAAGWLDAELEYVPAALKQMMRQGGGIPSQIVQPDGTVVQYADGGGLTAAFTKLRKLKEQGLDDEDNIQDAMSAVRATMKQMGLIADDTPFWLRRRLVALARGIVLGEAYPEPAKATDEQAKRIRALIADLGGEIEARDKAERELAKTGEIVEPFLREALKHADKEVVGRAKKLLGAGHEPWKNVQRVYEAEPEPGIELPAPPPKPGEPPK